MSFLFKNKSIKASTDKIKNKDPLPGFFKADPNFNMDYTLPPQDKEEVKKEQSQLSRSQFQEPYETTLEEVRKGPLTVTLSYSGVIGVLFTLFLMGVLFFMTGFLSGMMVTEYALQSQSPKKTTEPLNDINGDDNV